MKIENGTLVFDSGRRLDAPFNMIGLDVTLNPNFGPLIGGGHDTYYPIIDPADPEHNEWHPDAFTAAECVDLADFMIERWKAFRDMHAPQSAVNIVRGSAMLSVADFSTLGTLARDLNE